MFVSSRDHRPGVIPPARWYTAYRALRNGHAHACMRANAYTHENYTALAPSRTPSHQRVLDAGRGLLLRRGCLLRSPSRSAGTRSTGRCLLLRRRGLGPLGGDPLAFGKLPPKVLADFCWLKIQQGAPGFEMLNEDFPNG